MSGSVALEYGFPSTHSTNAVSVAVYVLLSLRSATATIMPATKIFLEALAYFYATSIVVGRLYCGMHGFLDVIVGGFLGAGLSFIQFFYVDTFDAFITNGHYTAITITVLIILVLVRIHPEPADDCPCFDDSVAFAGVLCGVEAGKWHFSMTQYSSDVPCPGTVPFDLQTMGWITTMLRIVVGVLMIFAWKEVAKPTLLKALPPVFRIVERLGLSLPRKFFKQASEYDQVPSHLKTDSLMPSVSEIPNFISSISHPRRDRSISIGPQSTADAREALFFRQKRRRDSRASSSSLSKTDRMIFDASDASEKPEVLRPPIRSSKPHTSLNLLPTPVSSDLNLAGSSENEAALPTTLTPSDSNQNLNAIGRISRTPSQDSRENEKEERELFSQLPTPRVRYDVEVITKLVVYAGIGWLAVEGDPILFHYLGLGMKK